MRIGIVEDEKQMQHLLTEYVQKIICSYDVPCDVVVAENWTGLENEELVDILLLDYELEGKNGMEIAREYRRINPEVCIIFVTAHLEFACEGYEVQAFRYLVKPVNVKKLTEAVHDALLLKEDKKIILQSSAGEIEVPLRKIIYLEAKSQGKGSIVRTSSHSIEEKRSLANLEQLLGAGQFIRSHKSFLVNLGHIAEIDGRKIHFANGEMADLSVRNKTKVEHAWWKYQWERGSC